MTVWRAGGLGCERIGLRLHSAALEQKWFTSPQDRSGLYHDETPYIRS